MRSGWSMSAGVMSRSLRRWSALAGFLFFTGCASAPVQPPGPPPWMRHFESGKTELKSRNWTGALIEFEACLRLEPTQSACLWEAGWAHFIARDWSDAVAIWGLLQRNDPKYPGVNAALASARQYLRISTEMKLWKESARKTSDPRGHGLASGGRASRKTVPALRIKAAGDVMLGTAFPRGFLPPTGGPFPLDRVGTAFKDSDIGFVNLEGPLCDAGETLKCRTGGNCYAFRMPAAFAGYLKSSGINLVSSANNHVFDFGESCRDETERVLDRTGIQWSGRPGTFSEFVRAGIRIGFVAFHSSNLTNDSRDLVRARRLVKKLALRNAIVIVSVHGGAEGLAALHVEDREEIFAGENRGHLIKFARALVDAGASLVLGHGPHVPRGMELYRGHLIAYSLGNFATFRMFNLNGFNSVSPLLELGLDARGKLVSGTLRSFRQVGFGLTEPDPRDTAVDLIRYLSCADLPGTGVAIARDGTFGPGGPTVASCGDALTAPATKDR